MLSITEVANIVGVGIPPGSVGDFVGNGLGGLVGAFVGKRVGDLVGVLVGSVEGELVILFEGKMEGSSDGLEVGCGVGRKVGESLL